MGGAALPAPPALWCGAARRGGGEQRDAAITFTLATLQGSYPVVWGRRSCWDSGHNAPGWRALSALSALRLRQKSEKSEKWKRSQKHEIDHKWLDQMVDLDGWTFWLNLHGWTFWSDM
jgi:stalled ribosome alternative rescue factor ArfA